MGRRGIDSDLERRRRRVDAVADAGVHQVVARLFAKAVQVAQRHDS